MALSESRIRWMWSEAHNDTSDRMAYQVLAAMVEAEVRKEYDALIRQMLDAIESEISPEWNCDSYHPKLPTAAAAARAWLGDQK